MANKTLSEILTPYISEKIPKKATNILRMLILGIEAMFNFLEHKLIITKRERNILSAVHISSLRHLAAMNGFEPTLKIASRGLLRMYIDTKFFNRVGYPIFIPPYSVFIDKKTKLQYYYNSNKTLRIEKNESFIPVIEGVIETTSFVGTTSFIDRYYIDNISISNKSITISSPLCEAYTEVKTFFNNDNVNDNKQFIVKFSSDIQKPIIIYVKGAEVDEKLTVAYKITSGSYGNITATHMFETESLLNSSGENLTPDDDEVSIKNLSGFDFGSDGTDENTLRSAIGYNHDTDLLFNIESYKNFLMKFSTIMIQSIQFPEGTKAIHNIYLFKKHYIQEDQYYEYKNIIDTYDYLLSTANKQNLSNIISEQEYCLTSHNIYDPTICKFAIQILFTADDAIELHKQELTEILYNQFAIFLYDTYHIINLELVFNEYMKNNNINFEYTVFNSINEAKKLSTSTNIKTDYIITSKNYLPILKGDFNICDSNYEPIKLFFDLNILNQN